MSSILTNNSAMVALQTMKSISSNLAKTTADISTGKTQSNLIQSLQYQFNSIGNLVHRTNISIDETFGYDSRNQLTSQKPR